VSPRRFPPPWTVEEYNDACFVVRDANGQAKQFVDHAITRKLKVAQ
jgi:hypothetical protein